MTNPAAVRPSLPRPASHIVARRLRDSGVLVNLQTNEIFELNRTAMRVWELLGDSRDVQDLARCLTLEFDVERAAAEQAVRETLAHFAAQGLLDT